MDLDLLRGLAQPSTTKIVLCSLDGLGGLPRPETGKSELETARIPHLHALAARSACGLLRHVGPGITPGSGPGHLGLFGYDPLRHPVGRGVLEALGIDFPLTPGDVAARGNFCTVDGEGRITDRRAGRISTDLCVKLCERLRQIHGEGAELLIEPVKEHRFVLVLRGPAPANMILLRGFDTQPALPLFPEIYGFRAAAIAAYPMYRGLARLVGMEVLKTGATFTDEIATLRQHWDSYDFFFVHYKDTDKAGEDGDFAAKVAALERFDAALPTVLELAPDVVIVTGD